MPSAWNFAARSFMTFCGSIVLKPIKIHQRLRELYSQPKAGGRGKSSYNSEMPRFGL